MDPQPGESVYDPTCGSGGLLLNCALHLKSEGKEYRNLKLYGQEINLITSAIARMNMFMHGIEEFNIVRGDTLANPAFLHNDELKKFNVILANPPYSISQWDDKSFEKDPFGRNIWGSPPAGCADYAFQQHIHQSLDPINGRTAILWPHGILFREMEKTMRENMIKTGTVECVIGLGANLFYNSPMEASILVCNNNKAENRKDKILFIDALNEVKREKTNSFLTNDNIERIHNAYLDFKNEEGFARVMTMQEVLDNKGNLKVSKYILSSKIPDKETATFEELYNMFTQSGDDLKVGMNDLFKKLG
jgi:type I restriction enzyme M protein